MLCMAMTRATYTDLLTCLGLQALHGKQGKRWGSKKERDESLKAEISQLQETVQKQQESQTGLQQEVEQLSSACMDKSQEIGNHRAGIEDRQESLARADRLAA